MQCSRSGGVSGLYMQITRAESKSWILRATIGAKRRDIGLGSYPDVSLGEARKRARELKDKIWQGIDPIEERKAARAALIATQTPSLTFVKAFEDYTDAKLDELGTDADRTRWKSSIERYVLPHIGDLPVSELTVHDVLQVLKPIWRDRTETASRVRSRIEAILSWAKVSGHRTGDNPAMWRGNLDALLPKPGRIADKGNQPAVAMDEAAGWFAALGKRQGVGAKALAFLTLCASRSGEVRGMTWGEIDMGSKIWTIPADRMKAEREHRVPLTEPALAIIKVMPARADSPFVFAAPRGGQLSDMTLCRNLLIYCAVNALVRQGFKATHNDLTGGGSACDAVATAIRELGTPRMNYQTVRQIYAKMKKLTSGDNAMWNNVDIINHMIMSTKYF